VRGGVVNLTTADRDAVCYVAAHLAVIQDNDTGEQTILQGHCNPICGVVTNPDRSLVATADIGADAMLVIWDARTGEPLHTVPAPTAQGFRALDMSSDGCLLAALTAAPAQQVHVWEVGPARDGGVVAVPLAAGVVRSTDPHRTLKFHPEASASDLAKVELLTQGRRSLSFWAPHAEAPDRLVVAEPTLHAADFGTPVGEFVASVFVPGPASLACTGTVDGDLVVWAPVSAGGDRRLRAAAKLVRVHSAPVTCLATVGPYLVTGGGEGFVRFFDAKLRLTAWFENIGAGGPTTVAFAASPADGGRPLPKASGGGLGGEGDDRSFACPDFVVATSRHAIVEVRTAAFAEGGTGVTASVALRQVVGGDDDAKRARAAAEASATVPLARDDPISAHVPTPSSQGRADADGNGAPPAAPDARGNRVLVRAPPGRLAAAAAHPTRPALALVTRAGRIERWDWQRRAVTASAQLAPGLEPSSVAFTRPGGLLVVGCAGGHVVVLDGTSLVESALLRNSKAPIRHLASSERGQTLAVGDAEGLLVLYALQRLRGVLGWELVGKYRGHPGADGLAGLCFVRGPYAPEGPGGPAGGAGGALGTPVKGGKAGGPTPGGAGAGAGGGGGDAEILVTVGRDGSVCEFDPAASSLQAGLHLRAAHPPGKFPGSPRALTSLGGDAGPGRLACPPLVPHQGAGPHLLVADGDLRLRLVDAVRRQVRATVLGPALAGPLVALQAFACPGTDAPCVAFATGDRVCGLLGGELDGLPRRSLAVVAHPGAVAALAVAHDGSRLFTVSGDDPVVNSWRVRPEAVDALAAAGEGTSPAAAAAADGGGLPVSPWEEALPGGAHGAAAEEARDIFTYCRALALGDGLAEGRPLPDRIPARLGPDALRALGLFPSDAELAAVLQEHRERTAVAMEAAAAPEDRGTARLRRAVRAAQDSLSLEDVLRIFVNHRPAQPEPRDEVERAFRALQGWAPPDESEDEEPEGPDGNRGDEVPSTARPARLHDAEVIPEDMEAAGSVYAHRLAEALAVLGEPMPRDEQDAAAVALLGPGAGLEASLPEICDPVHVVELLGETAG